LESRLARLEKDGEYENPKVCALHELLFCELLEACCFAAAHAANRAMVVGANEGLGGAFQGPTLAEHSVMTWETRQIWGRAREIHKVALFASLRNIAMHEGHRYEVEAREDAAVTCPW
jgi:hypothetical protein